MFSNIKNIGIRAVVGLNHLLCKKHFPKGRRRILLISTTGLGDTVWATPIIKALRRKFPDGFISMLTTSLGSKVFFHNPDLDEILIVNAIPYISLPKILRCVRRRKFDTAIILHASQRLVPPIAALSNASMIIGTKGLTKDMDWLLTHPIERRECHEIERRLDLIKPLDAQMDDGDRLNITLKDEEQPALKSKLKEFDIHTDKPIILLQPGAYDAYKMWPKEHFIDVAKQLKEKYGAQILVTGSVKEKALTEEIANEIQGISLSGKFLLREIMNLLPHVSLFITNDTGPMHLGYAQKIPTIALFSPTKPQDCGPFYDLEKVKVLYKPKTCHPCLGKRCRDPFCMRQISKQELLQAADELLKS